MNKILKLLADLRPNIDFLTLIQKIFHFFPLYYLIPTIYRRKFDLEL